MDLLPIIKEYPATFNVIIDKELHKKQLKNLLKVRREIRKFLDLKYPFVLDSDRVLSNPQDCDVLILEIMEHYLATGEIKIFTHKAI